MANNWKKTIMFGERKVNPLLTISGGLLGLVAAVAVFYFFAVSGEYNPKLIVFSFLFLHSLTPLFFSLTTFQSCAWGHTAVKARHPVRSGKLSTAGLD